jgi:hypothetical protein
VKTNPIRDLRKYSKQTFFRIIVGCVVLLFIIGDGLIYYFYGPTAATTGVICILGALAPVVIIVMVFWVIDWIIKKANRG